MHLVLLYSLFPDWWAIVYVQLSLRVRVVCILLSTYACRVSYRGFSPWNYDVIIAFKQGIMAGG